MIPESSFHEALSMREHCLQESLYHKERVLEISFHRSAAYQATSKLLEKKMLGNTPLKAPWWVKQWKIEK